MTIAAESRVAPKAYPACCGKDAKAFFRAMPSIGYGAGIKHPLLPQNLSH
jgi:hypothetical protein